MDVLTVQEAKHSTREKRVFTLNLGVFAKSFHELVWQKPLCGFANEADCVIRVRLGDLIQEKPFGDGYDQWWEVEDDVQSIESTTKQLVDALISKGLPFLEYFDTFSAVNEHLKKVKGWQAKNPLTVIYRALAEWRTGASDDANQTLTSIKGKAWETKAALVREIINTPLATDSPPPTSRD